MIKIGITGGIGSGKSTVCRAFAQLGVPVYDSDSRARRLMNEDVALKAAVSGLFGDGAYDADGLNRKYVAGRIFSDGTLRERLNAVVHPAVAEDFARWAERQQGPYVIEEAAILFESGAYRQSRDGHGSRARADPPYLPARRRRPGSGPRAHGRPDRRSRADRPRRLRDPLRRRGTRPAENSGTARDILPAALTKRPGTRPQRAVPKLTKAPYETDRRKT